MTDEKLSYDVLVTDPFGNGPVRHQFPDTETADTFASGLPGNFTVTRQTVNAVNGDIVEGDGDGEPVADEPAVGLTPDTAIPQSNGAAVDPTAPLYGGGPAVARDSYTPPPTA